VARVASTIHKSSGTSDRTAPHELGFVDRAAPRRVRLARDDSRVPRISEFYGIVIEMYFADHPPPRFHARYSGEEATIVISTGDLLAGSIPARALRLVREWLEAHRAELDANSNWDRARDHDQPQPVAPLR
jgi:hypothetical protein